MKKLRYICCQPAVKYYTWQVEVLIQNFKRMGINPNYIDIVCAVENGLVPEDWRKLQQHYNTIRFFFYNDTRQSKRYIPSIYFHLMKKHIVAQPEIRDDVLFIHDSDIVFTRPVDFSSMLNDKIWYLSDTNSYINYDYIQQKGNDVYLGMCEIIGIDPLIPKLLNSHSGGAQYIVKDTTYEYWDKVERNSHELYDYFIEKEKYHEKKHEHDYPIQKWTAGMWSMLWNAWLFGHETCVDRRMDFGWVTNHISDVEKYTILHNSGVTENHTDLFFKGRYINKLPYFDDVEVNEHKASYYYWQQIQAAAENTILLPNFNHS